MAEARRAAHPLAWVPSAYFAEGIPFAIVIWVAGTMFKDLGHSDGEITIATGSIALAWSLKPFWAAFLDMYRTKRFFVLSTEFLMAAVLAALALAVRWPGSFEVVIFGLWILAFASATQDICVDGVYLTSLDRRHQAAFGGVQGAGWNAGRIFATGFIVWTAGSLREGAALEPRAAWSLALLLSGAVMALLGLYHALVLPTGSLPEGALAAGGRRRDLREVAVEFAETVRDFLGKKSLWGMLLFVLLYRSGEGFLLVEAPLFLQAPLADGGAGLSLAEKGLIDGTISTLASIGGGLAGGVFVSRFGLARSLVFMALCLNVPHLCFVYLSQAVAGGQALSLTAVATLVTIEKLGYSFGFVANMLYMMQQIAPGKYPMTHYAFCTALMNLMLIPTQMLSGPLADWLGYQAFFVFVMFASVPSVLAAWFAPFPNPGSVERAPGRTAEEELAA
jgi:MFS transporter, PAT family, beta-lactamase induction signal transducer AmpG